MSLSGLSSVVPTNLALGLPVQGSGAWLPAQCSWPRPTCSGSSYMEPVPFFEAWAVYGRVFSLFPHQTSPHAQGWAFFGLQLSTEGPGSPDGQEKGAQPPFPPSSFPL